MLGQQVHRVGGYREYANAGDMSDCVEAAWMHVPPAGAASVPTIHRVIPDPAVSLCFEATRSSAEALEWLLAFVRERRAAAGAAATASPLVRRGLDVLRRQGGLVSLEALPAGLGISDRHLRRIVADAAGISPGRFARLRRFHGVLRETDHAPKPNWAAIAARFGYADQPHLIRDIRSLSGLSPVQLHRERRAEPA